MANRLLQSIANTGGAILTGISKIAPQTAGSLGKAADVVGKALNNPLPQAQAGDITGIVQTKGGEAEGQKVYDKLVTQGLNPKQAADITTESNKLKSGSNNTNVQLNGDYKLTEKTVEDAKKMLQNQGWTDQAAITAEANRLYLSGELNKNDNNGNQDKGSDEDIINKWKEKTGTDITQDIFDKIKTNSGSLDSLIEQMNAEQIAAATESYNAAMENLQTQKGELGKTSEYQKEKVLKQREADIADLDIEKESDLGTIEKSKKEYQAESAETEDTLASNWRALSLNTQAIARARGITNSDFAAQQESKQMLEFNKGLRTLAVKDKTVLQDFFDAVTNTNKYYDNANTKIVNDSTQQVNDIDEWLRSSIVSIQQQERTTLGQKLSDIKTAAANATAAKLKIEEAAVTRQNNLEDWLMQTKVNFDNSMKLAASGNVQSAGESISDIAKLTATVQNNLESSISTGNSSIETIDGKSYYRVYDPYDTYTILGGQKSNQDKDYSYIPLTESGAKVATTNASQTPAEKFQSAISTKLGL